MRRQEQRFPFYGRLIRLYPEPYRSRYGQQILQTLADMLDEAPDRKARLGIRSRLLLDLPSSLAEQYITTGGTMLHDTPNYIKRTALIGASLLIPFVLALAANTLDSLLFGRTLYASWLWHMPVLAIWVLWLPLAAALLALGSIAVYEVRTTHAERKYLTVLTTIRRIWPLLAVSLVALGILAVVFGHDSGHCLVQNPVTTATHIPQTLACIQHGSANYPLQHPTEFLKRALGL